MKNYKEFEKVCIGGSDIASLLFRQPMEVKEIGTGEDGTYYAYIIDTEEDIEIGEHYEKVYETNGWLMIYDDDKRTLKLEGNYDIYQSNKTFILKKTKKHNFEFEYYKKSKEWVKIQFYSVNDIKELEKALCNEENYGNVIIFKNGSGKYIKGLIFENCISTGNACKEYEYLDACINDNETRKTANSTEIIEGLKFKVIMEE